MVWRCLVLLGAARVAVGEDRDLPHVVDGHYDRTWYPDLPTSLEELRRSLSRYEEWSSVMVAAFDDTGVGESCGGGEAGLVEARIALRSAQRQRAARFMRIAIARRSEWEGEWLFPSSGPGRGCGVVLLEPRDDWATQRRSASVEGFAGERNARNARGTLARVAMDSVRVNSFTFRNALAEPIRVHWFDIGQEEGLDESRSPYAEVAVVPAGRAATIGTSIGHVFGVSDDAGHFITKVTVRGQGDEAVIDAAHLETEALECSANGPHDPHAAAMHAAELARLEALGSGPEGVDARVRFAVLEHVYDLAMEKRKALSDVQISVTPNVTADGFKLIRTPAHVYDKVIAFYNASHDRIRRPEADGGPLYNQRRVRTWHTPLDGRLKAYVFDELKRLMEDWAPTTAPLKGTSAYGVRTYERGAYLHLHVDTANTHVVSGIMNVDQAGVDEPWPLEILDHAGKLHAVNMEPGDFLLYESARLLHGRPSPFRGDSYANIFVHYMPEHDWSVDF